MEIPDGWSTGGHNYFLRSDILCHLNYFFGRRPTDNGIFWVYLNNDHEQSEGSLTIHE